MITVTLEKRNGVAIGASENATMGIESKMLARPPQPLTANTTSSKCRLWVKMDKGGPVVEEWIVTETYATVKANLTTDDAEAGAELTANKATDFSTQNNTLYPSVLAVENRVKKTPFGTSASAANTYVATLSPDVAVVTGLRILLKCTNANTGASTLETDVAGAFPIVRRDGSTALSAADLPAGKYVPMFYDGTSWVCENVG